MDADERVAGRRDVLAFVVGDGRELRKEAPPELVVVDHVERLDPRLQLAGERVVGGEHVGELGLPALRSVGSTRMAYMIEANEGM